MLQSDVLLLEDAHCGRWYSGELHQPGHRERTLAPSPHSSTHTRCYTHYNGTWGRADMTSNADFNYCSAMIKNGLVYVRYLEFSSVHEDKFQLYTLLSGLTCITTSILRLYIELLLPWYHMCNKTKFPSGSTDLQPHSHIQVFQLSLSASDIETGGGSEANVLTNSCINRVLGSVQSTQYVCYGSVPSSIPTQQDINVLLVCGELREI